MRLHEILTHDYLIEHHYNKRLSAKAIGESIGCTNTYVCMMMKKHGIANRSNEYKIGVPSSSSTKFKKGIRPWNTGLSCPSPNKGKTFPRREKHWNWKGGKSDRRLADPYYRDWRKAVFQRDDYTCQHCGDRGGNLNADHIEPWATFPEKRYLLENGRTLCVPCHRKTPTYGGRGIRKKSPKQKINDGGVMKASPAFA